MHLAKRAPNNTETEDTIKLEDTQPITTIPHATEQILETILGRHKADIGKTPEALEI